MIVSLRWRVVGSICVLASLWLTGCQSRNVEAGRAAAGQNLLAIDIPKARVSFQGMLTGGQPTLEQLRKAADMGFRTVINLRPVEEDGAIPNEAAIVADLGMRYVYIPIEGAEGLSEENANRFAEALAEAASPALIHCASGNRVGALFSLKAFLVDGASVEEAMKIGLDAGMGRLKSATRDFLNGRRPADLAESATPQ